MSRWTFDGRGVNGSDEYRTRLATLTQAATPQAGRLMAAAPELLRLLRALLPVAADGVDARDRDGSENADEGQAVIDSALALLERLQVSP